MKNTEKVKRLVVILAALAVFAAPLAYAQSDIFIGAKKNKEAQDSSDSKRPTIFITPGDKKKTSAAKPFFGKKVFRSDSRLDVYSGVARPGAKLVMPNMNMRGSKTPTKEDLMMMATANRQKNFEIMQKNSALKLQQMQKNAALRKQDKHTSGSAKKVAAKTSTAKKEQDRKRAEKLKKDQEKKRAEKQASKPKVFITSSQKKKSGANTPRRIFNTYD